MVVSFKISKSGRRFCPKPILSTLQQDNDEEKNKIQYDQTYITTRQVIVASTEEEELEVSFALNLFPDGYSFGRPSDNQPSFQAMLQNPPKFLHPYDRTSEALFSAIESGRLPGDILDDIPCKYVDGTVVCEVRDYRKCSSEAGSDDVNPIMNKVRLRMSLENVVNDIPLISDNTWTYGDLIEFESRILKTLQPQLCLDPAPKLDRLCENPDRKKLNLDVRSMRKRRREIPEVIVTSNNLIHGKKVCIDRVMESSSFRVSDEGSISGILIPRNAHENAQDMVYNNAKVQIATNFLSDASLSSQPFVSQSSKYPLAEGAPTMMRGRGTNSNAPGASPSGQDMTMSYRENIIHARRDNQDGPVSPVMSLNKRARLTSSGSDGTQQQHMGAPMDSLQGSDLNWNNTSLHHQQFVSRGLQYPNNTIQKFSQQMYEGSMNQETGTATQSGMKFPKKEPVGTDKSEVHENRNDLHMVEAERIRMQQRLHPQNAFMRSNFSQPAWNNFNQPIDNNLRMENQLQKRKLAQSHHVSGGGLLQSQLPTNSGDFYSGSVGPQFGPVIGSSHEDKSAVNSVPAVGGASSLTSNENSMQRQHVQLAVKHRSNSLPKTPAANGIGSPASVGNMSVPLNASSPAYEMLTQVDPMILDRFSKIELVAARHHINRIKNKNDEKPIRKPTVFNCKEIMVRLSNESSGDHFIDESENKKLAKSCVGGSMNACKIRVLTFAQNERIMQGNGFALVPKSHVRMMLSANPSNGTIAMCYGDTFEGESLTTEEYLPTLPNAHLADLLAAQFSSLMTREGYETEDNIYPKPVHLNHTQLNGSGIPHANARMEIQQHPVVVSGQQIRPTNSSNLSLTPDQDVLNQSKLPPQNPHALLMSRGFLPTIPRQNEPQSSSLQQQPNLSQRPPVMLQSNQLPQGSAPGQNTNPLLGNNQMVYKPSQLQIQLMQQQQQQPPRKLMMGMGGNMANNMVRIGGHSNVMGIGGQTISGMGQNPMNIGAASNISNTISQQIRTGQLTPQAIMALRMANRGRMGGAQSSLGGIPGARQMHPDSSGLSMLGDSLNRGVNLNPMQRSPVGPMGPPKSTSGMNLYMIPQLQQQQQQQQHQMQLQSEQIQQQFQQQQLQQQQDSASPLQAVVSPPQQSSQQQQQANPQQMSQQNSNEPTTNESKNSDEPTT